MLATLQQLDEAMASLAAVNLDSLTDGELHDLAVGVQRCRSRLGAVAARPLGAWDARGVWACDGSRSAGHRLARECNMSVRSAKAEVRRARHLASMPVTAAAVVDGRLSLDHVDLLGRANQSRRDAVFADHEEMLVEQCAILRYADAARMVDYWCHGADSEAAEDDAERKRSRAHLHASPTFDGTVVLNGTLDAIGGAIVTGELERLERELYLADQRDGVERTKSQRLAAALVEMALRSAAMPADAQRLRPLFTVLLGDDNFSKLCELANGTVITPGTLTPWLSNAEMETVLFDGPSTVVSVSSRRSFCGAVRRAVEVRDRHCQHPSGCDVAVDRCDVDHIVPWIDGGETSQFNGRLECTTHNRHADKHDHSAEPQPSRPVTRLDELRARLRWRHLHEDNDGDGDDDADGDPDPVSETG